MIHFEDTPRLLRDKGRRWRAAMESLWQRMLLLFVRVPNAPVVEKSAGFVGERAMLPLPAPTPPPSPESMPPATRPEQPPPASARVIPPEPEAPIPPPEPPPIETPSAEATVTPIPPPIITFPHRPGKFVKPKGLEQVVADKPQVERKPRAEPKPRRPKLPLGDDPEQWGQYYFRDVVLDQLDRYFVFLRRMKVGDRSSYDLLHQVGIQLMPYSATKQFDRWRDLPDGCELSPWWHTNRPAFGALAYGFDDVSEESDETIIADAADPNWKAPRTQTRESTKGAHAHRPFLLQRAHGAAKKYDPDLFDRPSTMWTPRFLYFNKLSHVSKDLEHIAGGDTYRMTVYWDRNDKNVAKEFRSNRGGGRVQDYGVWIEHGSGRMKILRSKINEKFSIKFARGPNGGGVGASGGHHKTMSFTRAEWTVPDRYLWWAHRGFGENSIEPEEYLRRMFVEAAALYESSILGSMIRVAVTKRALVATFGVEIKRTAYFFQDRDIVLTVNGRKKRIFHIVRPHVRKNGDVVPMHFRGLHDFDWAGYHVSITVPGRDHFFFPEFDVGMKEFTGAGPIPSGWVGQKKLGQMLVDHIKKGHGAIS
jgi:hypothetical protein